MKILAYKVVIGGNDMEDPVATYLVLGKNLKDAVSKSLKAYKRAYHIEGTVESEGVVELNEKATLVAEEL